MSSYKTLLVHDVLSLLGDELFGRHEPDPTMLGLKIANAYLGSHQLMGSEGRPLTEFLTVEMGEGWYMAGGMGLFVKTGDARIVQCSITSAIATTWQLASCAAVTADFLVEVPDCLSLAAMKLVGSGIVSRGEVAVTSVSEILSPLRAELFPGHSLMRADKFGEFLTSRYLGRRAQTWSGIPDESWSLASSVFTAKKYGRLVTVRILMGDLGMVWQIACGAVVAIDALSEYSEVEIPDILSITASRLISGGVVMSAVVVRTLRPPG